MDLEEPSVLRSLFDVRSAGKVLSCLTAGALVSEPQRPDSGMACEWEQKRSRPDLKFCNRTVGHPEWMRHECGGWIPRQGLGMPVSCREHERSGAPRRHAPVRANVDESCRTDRRLAGTEIPLRIAVPGSPSPSALAPAHPLRL